MTTDIEEYLSYIHQKRNIFLNSPGGCGKSYILKSVYNHIKHNLPHIKVALTSSTGISAVNIGGVTLHHYTGIGLGKATVQSLVTRIRKDKRFVNNWRSVDYIFLDEISMLGGSLLDKLEEIARIIRGNKQLFGGIKFIVSGDNLQLPPINDYWFFQSEVWQKLDFTTIRNFTPYRYPDIKWFNMLMRIRVGNPKKSDIKKLRQRIIDSEDEIPHTTKLYSKNKDVQFINALKLSELDTQIHSFQCFDFVKTKDKLSGGICPVDPKDKSYEGYTKIMDDAVPQLLDLKIGAECLVTFNVDVENGIANGTRCTIIEFIIPNYPLNNNNREKYLEDIGVRVKLNNGEITIIPYEPFSIEDDEVIYTRIQMPLKIAYAITIHKCISKDSQIYTSTGLKRLRDIQIGDNVDTGTGIYRKVINKFYSGMKKIVRIITDNEYALECSEDHLILDNTNKFKSANKFIVGETVPICINFGNNELHTIKEIIFKEEYIDMYDLEIEEIHQFVADGFIVHNCQGLTLPSLCTSIGSDIFCSGQAYVALSRCKRLEDLYLLDFDPKKIIVDSDALEFEYQFDDDDENCSDES